MKITKLYKISAWFNKLMKPHISFSYTFEYTFEQNNHFHSKGFRKQSLCVHYEQEEWLQQDNKTLVSVDIQEAPDCCSTGFISNSHPVFNQFRKESVRFLSMQTAVVVLSTSQNIQKLMAEVLLHWHMSTGRILHVYSPYDNTLWTAKMSANMQTLFSCRYFEICHNIFTNLSNDNFTNHR